MTGLDIATLSNAHLIAVYNYVADKPVKRFERRPIGETRVLRALAEASATLDDVAAELGITSTETQPEAEAEAEAPDHQPQAREGFEIEDEDTENDLEALDTGFEPEDEGEDDEQSAEAIMRRNAERLAAQAPEAPEAEQAETPEPEQFGPPADAAPVAAEPSEQPEDDAEPQPIPAEEDAQFIFTLPCSPSAAEKIALALANLTGTPVKFGECECSAIGAGTMVEPRARGRAARPAPATKAKRERAERPERAEAAPRQTKYDLSHTIKVLRDNPKRPGSAAHARFTLYRDGAPAQASLDAGVLLADIYHDARKGFIALVPPTEA